MLSINRISKASINLVKQSTALHTLVAKNARTMIPKALTTFHMNIEKSFSTLSLEQLPPNLTVTDVNILAEAEEPEITIEDYAFPLLNVPETIDVINFSKPGEKVSALPLSKTVFEVAIRKDVILNAVRYLRNMKRQPHKTKRMSEIAGSNKKPWRQKGLGKGQVGHRRNSAWKGGQKAHGPVLRDFSIGLNTKERALAMMMALAAKFREGNLYVFEKLELESHKTKDLKNVLISHGILPEKDEDAKVIPILVDVDVSENLYLSSRGIENVITLNLEQLDTYEVVRRDKLVMSAGALASLQERLVAQYMKSGKKSILAENYQAYLEQVDIGEAIIASTPQATATATN